MHKFDNGVYNSSPNNVEKKQATIEDLQASVLDFDFINTEFM